MKDVLVGKIEPNGAQSYAKKLAGWFSQIAAGGCLAMCIIYVATDGEANTIVMYDSLLKMLQKGILGENCFVKNLEVLTATLADDFLPHSMAFSKYRWVKVTRLKDVGDEYTLLKYKAATTKEGHWVVARNGEIVFNGLDSSINVNEGKIVEARQLVI